MAKTYSETIKFRHNIPLNAGQAFSNAIDYRNFAYENVPKDLNMKVFKNFYSAKNMLYGRINQYDIPIFIKDDRRQRNDGFVSLNNQQDSITSLSCIDFVADAFNDMLKDFKKAELNNRIVKGEKYDSLKPVRSFTDPKANHNFLLRKKYDAFLSYLTRENKDNSIFNFRTFLTYYFEYLEDTVYDVPVTMTGFLKSKYCPPRVSGLIIDLYADSHMSDDIKVDEYINSSNFCFFASAALKHGFSIDYNAPWRIVADLESPAMKQYMSGRFIGTSVGVLNYYYEPAQIYGFEEFKNSAFKLYNSYVRKRPLITLTHTCPSGNLKQKLIKRERITRLEFDSLYNDEYWIEKYIMIRNLEENSYLSGPVEKMMILDAKSLLNSKIRSTDFVVSMVEKKLINFEDKTGSASFTLERLRDRTVSTPAVNSARAAFASAGSSGNTSGGGSSGGSY
jgi:hypothetical protein